MSIDPGAIVGAAAAAALSYAGYKLAVEYGELAEEAIWMANNIAERIFAIEEDITDHWMNNQHPQMIAVLDEVFNYTPPQVAYGAALDYGVRAGENLKYVVGGGVRVTLDRYQYYLGDHCDRETDLMVKAAEIDFAQQLMRHEERREERQTQEWIEASAKTYWGTRESPDDIFSLLRNAQSTYSNIYNAALQSESGAIGIMGYGIGTFIGGFFNT